MLNQLPRFAFIGLVLVGFLASCEQDSQPRSYRNGSESLTLSARKGRQAAAKTYTKEELLGFVDSYLNANTNTFTWGNTAIYGISTYMVDDDHLFYKVADTYDNALAAIYWSETGKPVSALKLLNSYLRLMGFQGYNPAAATVDERLQAFKGLPVRYSFKSDQHLVPPYDIGGSKEIDTGNNSYMGIAFCKFFNKHHAQLGSEGGTYRQAAYDMWAFLHRERKCSNNTGYQGRVSQGGWVSTEHNIDMYALAQCLLTTSSNDQEKAELRASLQISGSLVASMYDASAQAYKTGKESCTSVGPAQALPVDAQTWRYLAEAEETSPNPSRTRSSLMQVLGERFFTPDSYELPNGCEVNPPQGMEDYTLCSQVADDQLVYGVRFSDRGLGIQLENTASAYMALARYEHAHPGDLPAGPERLAELRTTLTTLLGSGRQEGVYASLRSHAVFTKDPSSGQSQPYLNTGFTWDYFRVPHTASTVWTGLALAYRYSDDEQVDEGFNPYAASSSRQAYEGGPARIAGINRSAVTTYSCANADALSYSRRADHKPACLVGGETLGEYCSILCGGDPAWFKPELDADPFLVNLGIDRASLCSTCQHTALQGCSDPQLLKISQYIWKSYNAQCVQESNTPVCVVGLPIQNYNGHNWNFCMFGEGDAPRYDGLTGWNDNIRSLVIPRNLKATFCTHRAHDAAGNGLGKGFCRSYFESTPWVGPVADEQYSHMSFERFHENDFTMAVVSDTQYGFTAGDDEMNVLHAKAIKHLADRIGSNRFAGVIINGDLTNTATSSQLNLYIKDYEETYGFNVYPGLGNHDYDNYSDKFGNGNEPVFKWFGLDTHNLLSFYLARTLGYQADATVTKNNETVTVDGWKDFVTNLLGGFHGLLQPWEKNDNIEYRGSLAYSWNIGQYHFVQLNNYPSYELEVRGAKYGGRNWEQYNYDINSSFDWLENDLAKHRNKKVILNFHVMSTDNRSVDRFSRDADPAGWKRLQDILAAHPNVVAIFAGHIHSWWPSGSNNNYITAGSRRVPVVFSGAAEYQRFLRVRFLPERLEINVIDSSAGTSRELNATGNRLIIEVTK